MNFISANLVTKHNYEEPEQALVEVVQRTNGLFELGSSDPNLSVYMSADEALKVLRDTDGGKVVIEPSHPHFAEIQRHAIKASRDEGGAVYNFVF